MKKKIIILAASLLVVPGITLLGGFSNLVEIVWIRNLLKILANLCMGGAAFGAMKLTGVGFELDLKNKKQYGIGIGIALLLSLSIAVIPALCGHSLVGAHKDFSWSEILFSFLFYLAIIGPVEELVFRVYLQETLISLFKSNQWIGVVIAALLFGALHLINGSLLQGLFTFGIGLIFGFSKYLIKDCKYPGLALGHGLYDFLNVIVRMFVV